MRVPESLAGLLDQGIIEEVVRPLMSGKEAHVYLVIADGEPRVAKIYKDSQHRSFKQRSEYTEGRRVRSSRDQRAIDKRTRYGRKQDEASWKSAEVDMIYRLRNAGVRVPEPFNFVDGVLLMELIQDEGGLPAPRLAEVDFDRDEARAIFDLLLREVVKMLCAGVVHGDLSEYNVLLDETGPVIIDFPQSVDAASNQNAKKLLLRDVDNLTRFLVRLDHRARPAPYGHEIWAAYERNRLSPDMKLTGRRQRDTVSTDTSSLLDEIEAAERDEAQRRRSLGLPPRRREVTIQPSNGRASNGRANGRGDGRRPPQRPDERRPADRAPSPAGPHAAPAAAQASDGPARRRRRRRKKPGAATDGAGSERASAAAGSNGQRADARAPHTRDQPHDPRQPEDRRPREAGASREPNGPPNRSREPGAAPGNGAAEMNGPPKRRRRRRRRRSGDGARPPAGPPGTDG